MSLKSLDPTDEEFYTNAVHYWSEIPATLDGMLGGFGFISQTDIKGSKMLLKQLFNSKDPPGRQYALDCGAGIGRISKFLLTDMFEKVDLVEQNSTFLNQAKKYLGPTANKIGNYYPEGLQTFRPVEGKYDVIWIQWVLGHLTNKDLINFLIACRNGLKKNGVIIIKENVTSTDEIEKDEQDSSVTRPLRHFHLVFQNAKLNCYRQTKQHHFPKGLFSVYMFVLKPSADLNERVDEDTKEIDCNIVSETLDLSETNIKKEQTINESNLLAEKCITNDSSIQKNIDHVDNNVDMLPDNM